MRYEPFNGLGKLLVILLETGEISVSELRNKYSVALNTLYRYIELGRRLGLIADRYEEKPPNRRFIVLTEKGVAVAKKLREIYGIMGWLEP